VRVSIDGPNAETNDPIRGEGTFDAAMEGVRSLLRHGFLPIITATRVWPPEDDEPVRQAFESALRACGYDKPRIKLLPSLRIGREAVRAGGYGLDDRVTAEMLDGYDSTQLLCSSSRVVTSRGVHVCPILVDQKDSLLGVSLEDAATPFALSHGACYTCWLYGAICSNYGGIGEDSA
jgi:MoaA/NifB/PqqE/SkfB family radical SAM enzyme